MYFAFVTIMYVKCVYVVFMYIDATQTPTEDRSCISNIIHLLRALFVQAEDEYQNVCI